MKVHMQRRKRAHTHAHGHTRTHTNAHKHTRTWTCPDICSRLRPLQVRIQNLGKQHPATANSLNNLGGVLMGQGKVCARVHVYELVPMCPPQ